MLGRRDVDNVELALTERPQFIGARFLQVRQTHRAIRSRAAQHARRSDDFIHAWASTVPLSAVHLQHTFPTTVPQLRHARFEAAHTA